MTTCYSIAVWEFFISNILFAEQNLYGDSLIIISQAVIEWKQRGGGYMHDRKREIHRRLLSTVL